MAEPTKKEPKADDLRHDEQEKRANTTALAASTGSRRGTASSEARMTPVEYSAGDHQHAQHADGELAQARPPCPG